MSIKNIDDLIVNSMNEQAPVTSVNSTNSRDITPIHQNDISDSIDHSHKADTKDIETSTEEIQQEEQQTNHNPQTESPIDEYGNPIPKSKLYTQDEVEQIVKGRLSRVKNQVQKEYKPTPVQNDQQPSNEDDAWLSQLENVIDNRLERRQKEVMEEQWRQQEEKKMQEFEHKFSSGKDKYPDFDQVISGISLTEHMLLATRNLDNPAAFLYGAKKLHSSELTRISQIDDPYVQASEIGRLHEKMVKESKNVSKASQPLEPPKGDIGQKNTAKVSLEDRISQYAKQKRR